MRILFLAVMLFVAVLAVYPRCAFAQQKTDKCNAIELVEGGKDYNSLVCQGHEAMSVGNYRSAIDLLEKAAAIHLFETPNYKLYPTLALAYFKTGNEEKAKEYLEKARLALSIVVGIMHCEDTDSSFYIAEYETQVVDSKYNKDIAQTMCGEAYEEAYAGRTLKGIAADAELIKYYFSVRTQIEASAMKDNRGHS